MKTVKNAYPLRRIDTLLDKLDGPRHFSALDLASGYHQINLSDTAKPKTAFKTPDGLYQWTVMPFGLSNAPSVFQQAMHVVLKGLIGKICLAYLDYIIDLARTPEEHAANLDTILSRLHEHQFFRNVEKCQFAMQGKKYLGHVVTAYTVKPDPHKVEVLRARPSADIKQSNNNIQFFLGLAGSFRRVIPKLPTLAASLLERVSSKEKLPWAVQCEQSLSDIKNALINATALHHPDLSKPFHVYSDASDYAFGAVLTQKHEHELKPVAWAGRKTSKAEVNYYTLEKELAAITFASRQWRCYLENNQPVYIHSDHNPQHFLQTLKKLTGKRARWAESLSRINWYITYIPGDKNVVAEAISRAAHLPLSQVVLHDGHTLAAEKPQEPYSALSLTTALVRRDPIQFYETTSSGYPTLVDGSGATSSGKNRPRIRHAKSPQRSYSPPPDIGELQIHIDQSDQPTKLSRATTSVAATASPPLPAGGNYGAPPNAHHPQVPAPHNYVDSAQTRGDPTAPHTPQPICFTTTPSDSRELGEDFEPGARERNVTFRGD